jgi:hypothetical protein
LDRSSRHDTGRARQFSDRNMHVRHLRAPHRDCHCVVARVAGVRLNRRKTVIFCLVVVVVVGYRCLMVLMRGWAVVVLRMIVPEILVHMQRRPRCRRDDQGLNKRACDEATHRVQSTMTAAVAGQTPDRVDPRESASPLRSRCWETIRLSSNDFRTITPFEHIARAAVRQK